MSLTITSAQLNKISALGGAKNYPAMYNYIANEVRANRISGASIDQIYWFDQAAKINANEITSPSTVFVRTATIEGLYASGFLNQSDNLIKIQKYQIVLQ